jgi:hypothetical protein
MLGCREEVPKEERRQDDKPQKPTLRVARREARNPHVGHSTRRKTWRREIFRMKEEGS